MQDDLRLGYLAFETRRPKRWAEFCRHMLGLPEPLRNDDNSFGWQIDDAAQRLIVEEGRGDDLAALGLQCTDDAALARRLEHVNRAGVSAREGDVALRRARRVRALHHFVDPMGNRIELFTDPQPAERAFSSEAFPGGFQTGELGLGHAVLVARDLPAMEAFYTEVLGFRVSERLATRVGPIDFRGIFLHCNARHHSLALFDLPLSRRLHHFMLQANRIADVGRAFERARRHKVPLSLGLGQHPEPDGTFSFYGATPSGFDFEIGAATQAIDPKAWRVREADATSIWGHQPKWRIRWQMAVGLIARRLMASARSPARSSPSGLP